MNQESLIEKFFTLGSRVDKIDDEIAILKKRQTVISNLMEGVEDAWLETHMCSCGLLGVTCVHTKGKDGD